MTNASNVQTDFRGGMWSRTAQGRMDDPRYVTAMNESLNGLPLEDGSWTRRPPFRSVAFSRDGAAFKLHELSINGNPSHAVEITDGWFRFFEGGRLVMTEDGVTVSSITDADPGVVTISDVRDEWDNGTQVVFQLDEVDTTSVFPDGYAGFQRLVGRVWEIENMSGNSFTLRDPVRGDVWDGTVTDMSNLGDAVLIVSSVLEFPNDYIDGDYADVTILQTDQKLYFLHESYESLVVNHIHSKNTVTFEIEEADFRDGPYLDQARGVQAKCSGERGIIDIRFDHTPWDATHSYAKGNRVQYGDYTYRSLEFANLNNQPDTSPNEWLIVEDDEWVNGGKGFQDADVGRHIRLYSEPPIWDKDTDYTKGDVVTFRKQYYKCITDHSADGGGGNRVSQHRPGSSGSSEDWVVHPASRWVWGKITAVGADVTPETGTPIGNFDDEALAFDLDETTHAVKDGRQGFIGLTLDTPSVIDHCTVVALERDPGFIKGEKVERGFGLTTAGIANVVIKLRGKQGAAPSNAQDGTVLHTKKIKWDRIPEKIRLNSKDVTTVWDHAWVEIQLTFAKKSNKKKKNSFGYGDDPTDYVEKFDPTVAVEEVKLFDSHLREGKIQVEVLWGHLPYYDTTKVRRVHLGKYTNAVDNENKKSWPHAGCFHDGRVWLSSKVNEFDAFVPGRDLLYRPTMRDGTVTDGNGLSFTFNAQAQNKIEWMVSSDDGVMMGTASGEWLVSSPGGDPISPTNIDAHAVSQFGSSAIAPIVADVTTIFVHKNERLVYEFFKDKYFGVLVGIPLQEFSKSLTETGILQLAYSNNLAPVIWGVSENGELFGSTYKRTNHMAQNPPEFNGWHHHTHGHEDRTFTTVAGTRSLNGDGGTILVGTLEAGTGYYRVEVMDDPMLDGDDIFMSNYLDGAYVPASAVFYLEGVEDIVVPAVPESWSAAGWTLLFQCGTFEATSVPSDMVGLTAYTDPVTLVETYYTRGQTYPTGGCGYGGFVATGAVPGTEVFVPGGTESTETVLTFRNSSFGNDSYKCFQRWSRDAGTVGRMPVVTYTAPVDATIDTFAITAGIQLNGLYDMENKTVTVFCCGLDLGDHFIVRDGTITIPFETTNPLFTLRLLQQVDALGRDWGRLGVNIEGKYNVPVVIGFKYLSRGQRLRAASEAESGAQNGPAFGKIRRGHMYSLLLVNSKGVRVGTDFDNSLKDVPEKTPGGTRVLSEGELLTAVIAETLDDDTSTDGMLTWETNNCWPCNVAAAGMYLKTEDQ